MAGFPGPDDRAAFSPDAGERSRVPVVFLRALAERTHVPFLLADLGALASADEEAPSAATWQEALDQRCRSLGLRARRAVWSTREAFGAAGRGCAFVSTRRVGAAACELFALDAASAKQVRITFENGAHRAFDLAAFASWLGESDLDAPRSWLVVEPRFPASLPSGGKSGVGQGAHEAHGGQGGHGGGHAAGHAPGHHGPPPFERLRTLLRPDRSDLWAIVLFAAAIGGLSLATPVAVQQLVNSIAFGGLVQPVVVLALLLLVVLGFSALLSMVQSYVTELIQQRIFLRVVIDVAERLPRVRLGAFDVHHGPELVNRVFDVVTVQKTLSLLLLEGTSVLLQTFVGLVVLSFYHPLMLAFSALLVAGIFGVVVGLGRRAVPTAIVESKSKYEVFGWLEELARHPSTFRDAAQRRYARRRAEALGAAWLGARRGHYQIVLHQLAGTLGLQVVASAALLALGGMLVVRGQLTLGQLVASELIITGIVSTVAKFAKQLESFYDLLAAIDKLSVLIDLPLERDGGRELAASDRPAEVALEGVDFGYAHSPVFRHLDLRIAAGEKVAVLGSMGSGKSSLLDLLFALREPSAGHVALDGHDYRDLSLESIREEVGLVRGIEVFAGTIRDNVRVGRRDIDEDALQRALEAVGLVEEIRQLPLGLDTPLSTDGRPLSQVQLTRLMIARAVLTRPRLLLLDRALEDLDRVARDRIGDWLFAPDAPWTTIVITEREDVLARCTRRLNLGDAESWPSVSKGTEGRS